MRIDKQFFKSLDALKKGAPIYCDGTNKIMVDWLKDSVNPSGTGETHLDYLSAFMPYIRAKCRDNIYMASETLWKASEENQERMMKVLQKEWLDDCSGAILIKDGGLVCYFVHKIEEEEDVQIREKDFDMWDKERCKGIAVLMYFDRKNRLTGVSLSSSRLCYELDNERRVMHDAPHPSHFKFANDVLTLLAFMQYAETEKVYIENGQKRKYEKETYSNASGYRVRLVDSRWIREIIRTEGFKVKGHFRLQPHKVNGEWTRKLIYIEEFEKHGYHRRAQKDL